MIVKLFTRHGQLVKVDEIATNEAPEHLSWRGRLFKNDFQQNQTWQSYTETSVYTLPDD